MTQCLMILHTTQAEIKTVNFNKKLKKYWNWVIETVIIMWIKKKFKCRNFAIFSQQNAILKFLYAFVRLIKVTVY